MNITDMDTEKLVADLQDAEGWVGHLYDDANGARIGPGSTVKGHPTIGWGFALDTAPLTQAEALPILTGRATDAWNSLVAQIPWAQNIPEPCQRALANMAYNLGVSGLLGFNTFLSLMQAGQYGQAADDLQTTLWWKQIGSRGPKIQALIKEGIT
jgi:lysozyme